MTAETQHQFTVENKLATSVFGQHDEYLHSLEAGFGVKAYSRGNVVHLVGDTNAVEQALSVLASLYAEVERGRNLSASDVDYAIRLAKAGKMEVLQDLENEVVQITARGKRIRPRTIGQRRYVEAIREYGLTFGIGPAGTGKTYLAVALAIRSLQAKEVNRIILTRRLSRLVRNWDSSPAIYRKRSIRTCDLSMTHFTTSSASTSSSAIWSEA